MELEPKHARFPVEIADGRIVWSQDSLSRFNALTSKLKNRKIDILVDELRIQRTIKQNSLYWLRNQVLARWNVSYDRDEYHAIMMNKCGYGRTIEYQDLVLWARYSSANLNTKQFSSLFGEQESVAHFLSEGGPVIELPTKENWKKYEI